MQVGRTVLPVEENVLWLFVLHKSLPCALAYIWILCLFKKKKKKKNWFYCFEFSWAVDVEWKKEKWNLGGFWSQLVCPCIGSILEISAAQVYHVSYHRLSKTVKLLEDQISMYNKCTGWQHSEFPEKIQTQRSEHRMILNSWCFFFHQNKLLSLRDNTLTLKIRPPAFGQVSW